MTNGINVALAKSGDFFHASGRQMIVSFTSEERHEIGKQVSLCFYHNKNKEKVYIWVSADALENDNFPYVVSGLDAKDIVDILFPEKENDISEKGYALIDHRFVSLDSGRLKKINRDSFLLKYYKKSKEKKWIFMTSPQKNVQRYNQEQAEKLLGDCVLLNVGGINVWVSYVPTVIADKMIENGASMKAIALLSEDCSFLLRKEK